MTVTDHVDAVNRAHHTFDWLEQHPTTRAQLGAGRDLLNRVHNLADTDQVRTSLHALEDLTSTVYTSQTA